MKQTFEVHNVKCGDSKYLTKSWKTDFVGSWFICKSKKNNIRYWRYKIEELNLN